MSDTATIDQTAGSDRLERLEATVEKLSQGLAAFSDGMVRMLSGQTISSTSAPAKRRGRPPKAQTAAATKPVERPLHPKAQEFVDIVKRRGRATQTEIAQELGIERSAVQGFSGTLLSRGLIRAELVKPAKGHRHIVYRRPDYVSIRGE